jgi:hypothetical protein
MVFNSVFGAAVGLAIMKQRGHQDHILGSAGAPPPPSARFIPLQCWLGDTPC